MLKGPMVKATTALLFALKKNSLVFLRILNKLRQMIK